MQAFGVGGADHNLSFRIERGPELEPPEPVGIVVTFAQNRRRRSLSYKEWFTPPDQNGCMKPGTPSKLRIQSPRAFASHRCTAVYSPVADNDSSRAPSCCRFKRCKEIIKVEEPSAKIGLAFFHLSAPSAYAKNIMPVGKN